MSRYIDADKLKELIQHKKQLLHGIGGDLYAIKAFDYILKCIDSQLTVEAKPVVHGEWIKTQKEKAWGKSTDIVCSICGKKCWLGYDFCPNCGADMRKIEPILVAPSTQMLEFIEELGRDQEEKERIFFGKKVE